jgi:hypothetical protein
MRILAAAVTVASLLSAQSSDLFSKAPPDVDAALRAKVTEFYGLHKESKFRAAEKLVCEDSKDAYFDSAKRAYKSFEIIRINYDPGFQSAKVVTNLEAEFFSQGGNMMSKMPLTSHWKVEAGSWCYFIPPVPKEVQTPFGVSKTTGQPAEPATLGNAASVSADPKRILAQLAKQVRVSRSQMKLKGYENSSDGIEIQNGTPGPLEVSFHGPDYPGLKITLTRTTIPPGGTSLIEAEYHPPDKSAKPTYKFVVTIEPVSRRIPVTIYFDLPEEVKRSLPPGAIRQ